MRITLVFLMRFVAIPIYAWAGASLLGVGAGIGLLAWGLADFAWTTQNLMDVNRKMGLRAALRSSGDVPAGVADTLRSIAARVGIEATPDIVVMDSAPTYENAVLTWPRKRPPTIAISRRMIESLPPDVLEALLAHELGHLGDFDRRVFTAARLLIWAIMPGLWLGVLAFGDSIAGVVFWIASRSGCMLLSLAMRRWREVPADEVALRLGLGAGLIAGLEWAQSMRDARKIPPWWLSTHPPLDERIARVRAAAVAPSEVIA